MSTQNLLQLLSCDAHYATLLDQLAKACQGAIAIDAELKIAWISPAYRIML